MKKYSCFLFLLLQINNVSGQKGNGHISAELPVYSVNVFQVLTEKTDTTIFLSPGSFQNTSCLNVSLWTFNVPNPNTSVGGTIPGGFIFGPNAFFDNQKGCMFIATGSVVGASAFYGFKNLIDTTSNGGYYQAHVLISDGLGSWTIAGSSLPIPYSAIDTSQSSGPQPTPFVFNPSINVSGDFIVMFDVFSQADTSSGAAIWANGPSCGNDRSYERWSNHGGTYRVVKISSEWNGPGGNPLLSDPYIGVVLQKQNLTSNILMVYPNPAYTSVNVSFDVENDIMGRIVVLNLAGQLVLTFENQFYTGKNTIGLNISSLASGIYVYRVFAGDSEMNGKIVKI
jgi:hypothetical protein